jgi:AbrB family looped-hinge helix DNA binding protein
MTATISSKGQVVIPREVRDRLGLDRDSRVRVEVDGDRVILIPIRRGAWRELKGVVRGPGLTAALEREHRDEVARER